MAIGVGDDPPRVVTQMPNIHEYNVERVCSIPPAGFATSLIYDSVLMAACAVHAFKVRHLPSNFNEAKFISMSIYSIVLLWLFFFPAFFTAKTIILQRTWLALFMLLNMLLCQFFLLYPKLYAVYFLPERAYNIRGAFVPIMRTTYSLVKKEDSR